MRDRLPHGANHGLTAREAVEWFREAAPRRPCPTEQDVRPFAEEINRLRRLKARQADAQERARQELAAEQLDEVRRALRVVADKMPSVIAEFGPFDPAVEQLGEIASAALDPTQLGAPSRQGRPERPWAAGARVLADAAMRVWATMTPPQKVSHQTPGPVATIVERALTYLDGGAPDKDVIAKQLQRTPPNSARSKRTLFLT